jgi:hypothetical protein
MELCKTSIYEAHISYTKTRSKDITNPLTAISDAILDVLAAFNGFIKGDLC